MKAALDKIIAGVDLGRTEAFELMTAVAQGTYDDIQIAGLLTALRTKGESVDEVAGFVDAMRSQAVPLSPTTTGLVDTCGTGGDGAKTFNISTATALVVAGMGIPVAKHGNRAVSSKCGSADVLEALGVKIDLPVAATAALLDDVGIAFLFAPRFHPAMRFVGPARRSLGVRTVFNILGPLLNPADVKRQLVGVFDGALAPKVTEVLRATGSERAVVVHGDDGADEVSATAPTTATWLLDGIITTERFVPESVGMPTVPPESLAGGDTSYNAGVIRNILDGQPGGPRDVVVLNAAFVARVAGSVDAVSDGIVAAQTAIDSGAAAARLDRLRQRSQELAREVS